MKRWRACWGASPRTGRPAPRWCSASSVLDTKLPTADAVLFRVLDRQLAERILNVTPASSFADRVRKAIADYLHREELSIDMVARVLAISERSLAATSHQRANFVPRAGRRGTEVARDRAARCRRDRLRALAAPRLLGGDDVLPRLSPLDRRHARDLAGTAARRRAGVLGRLKAGAILTADRWVRGVVAACSC